MTKLLFNKPHSETMKNEGKILELLADMALKQDRMVEELHTVKEELHTVKKDLSSVNSEIGKINFELVKLNLLSSEHTRAILKMSDQIAQVVDHEKRISKLESIALK